MRTLSNERSDKPISAESLCRFLKENYFELGYGIFNQLLGTAVGTKFEHNYSNIFMIGLEQNLFANYKFSPFLWLWSLNDNFCFWTDREEKLNHFLSI